MFNSAKPRTVQFHNYQLGKHHPWQLGNVRLEDYADPAAMAGEEVANTETQECKEVTETQAGNVTAGAA